MNLVPLNDLEISNSLKSQYEKNEHATRIGARGLVLFDGLKAVDTLKDCALEMYQRMNRDQVDCALFIRYGRQSGFDISGFYGSGKSSAFSAITNEWAQSVRSGESRIHARSSEAIQVVLKWFGSANGGHSRFLFYQEYQFSKGELIGIKTLDYGLENNRLTVGAKDESNFDIFYLLQGAPNEQKAKWHLSDPSHYKYLANYGITLAFGENDFLVLQKALKGIGIGSKTQFQVFALISGILLLGNILFQEDALNKQESCSIKNSELLGPIAELFGVSSSNLEQALTAESKVIQNELCTVYLTVEEAVYIASASKNRKLKEILLLNPYTP